MIWTILAAVPRKIWAFAAACGAVLVAVWRIYATGRKAGRNEARAKEADAYAEYLERIGKANAARDSVRPDGVRDDPANRDNWS